MDYEKLTEAFFKLRFPKKNIEFEKECGYFYEWVDRLRSENPTQLMDSCSLECWDKLQEWLK